MTEFCMKNNFLKQMSRLLSCRSSDLQSGTFPESKILFGGIWTRPLVKPSDIKNPFVDGQLS